MTDRIETEITNWLYTRKAPPGMDEGQRQALREQIIAIVKRHAPATGVSAWLGRVFEFCMINQKGLGWPSPDIWAAAVGGKAHATEGARRSEPSASDRAYAIFCQRVRSKDDVAEYDLFGWKADRALRKGDLLLADLRPYQRSAFMARVGVYGEQKALQWAESMNDAFARDMRALVSTERELRPQHASDDERGYDGGAFNE